MTYKEYVVTLYKFEDLESFYEDMENVDGNLYIPNRAVTLSKRRPVSRNTHYLMTYDEAELVRQDPRVEAVELSMEETGTFFTPSWVETSTNWSKTNTVSSTFKNWGLLRSIEGEQRANWGSDGTGNVSGTVGINASGKNVDVVIVDGHINPLHPEYSKNIDGTGGSRVIQYNWFELIPTVTSGSAGTYTYTPYIDPTYPDDNGNGISDRTDNNNHGAHVAGIVAGNTQGWAKDSNIYNLSPYSSDQNFDNFNFSVSTFLDYIKIWHRYKALNPVTGVKNPTVTNHSYGITSVVDITTITTVRYRGTIINGPFTENQLLSYGIFNEGGYTSTVSRNAGIEADLQDLINEGIIVISAAGNSYSKIDNYSVQNSDDYNNYYSNGTNTYYYNRGTFSAAPGVICVGGIGALSDDSKITYSNCGPRVDLYAPGEYVMSSINSNSGIYATDPRNSNFYITKKSGSSMASPQVAGVVACILETWPRASQTQITEYLKTHAKKDQIASTTGGPADYTDLQGSENNFLFFFKERKDSGQISPKLNHSLRPIAGLAWPRSRIFQYGR
jgi:subtilisin family serine protease